MEQRIEHLELKTACLDKRVRYLDKEAGITKEKLRMNGETGERIERTLNTYVDKDRTAKGVITKSLLAGSATIIIALIVYIFENHTN